MDLHRHANSVNSNAPLTARKRAGERYKPDTSAVYYRVKRLPSTAVPYFSAGGWETAMLALYFVLPQSPAEDQGAEERLWLLQLLVLERERPSLQITPSPPPPPTQTQQFTPQVCSVLCYFSPSHFSHQAPQPNGWFLAQNSFVSALCNYLPRIFCRLSGSLSPEQEQGLWKPRWIFSYKMPFKFQNSSHCF